MRRAIILVLMVVVFTTPAVCPITFTSGSQFNLSEDNTTLVLTHNLTADNVSVGGTYLEVENASSTYYDFPTDTVNLSISKAGWPLKGWLDQIEYAGGSTTIQTTLVGLRPDTPLEVDGTRVRTDAAGNYTYSHTYPTSKPVVDVDVILVLTAYNNKTSNTSTTYIRLDNGEAILLSANATSIIGPTTLDTHVWSIDNETTITGRENYTAQWTTPYNHYVTLTATNITTSSTNNITWRLTVYRALATKPIKRLNTSNLGSLETAVEDRDAKEIVDISTAPYRDMIGMVFYLIIFGIVAGMEWIWHDNTIIVSLTSILLGGLVLGMLPGNLVGTAEIMITLGIFGVVYSVYRSRY